MSFVESLLAYLANHVAAAAAIGGLTIAGGAVAVSQVVTDPEPVDEELVADDEEDETPAIVDDEAEETVVTSEDETEGNTEDEADELASPLDEEADDTVDEEADETEEADGNGRSQAVHDVIFGGEVQPGDPEFGRRVAEAASQGRSEQRGNSGNARPAPDEEAENGDDVEAEAQQRDARPGPNANAAAGQAKAQENRAKAQENRAEAQEKRQAGQDRRPAPGGEADADTEGDSAQGAPAARGRG